MNTNETCKDNWREKIGDKNCCLNKPLLMVIPPEGITITCPVHGEHFVRGPQITL